MRKRSVLSVGNLTHSKMLCGKLASFAAHAAAKLLQKKMADAVRGSSVLKITEHHLPERSFRFVVELE